MEYSIKKQNEVTEVHLIGRVTFEDNFTFKSIHSQLAESRQNDVVLDLLKVDLVDSAGLGLLLRVQTEVERRGQGIAMRIPISGPVRRLIDIAHFGKLIPVIG